jgi:SAM-dependent methyltransferase
MAMSGLEKTYRTHHEERHRSGFTFGGKERVEALALWIGKGRRVLDIGCRDGTLTVNILEGNFAVGADIDGDSLRHGRGRHQLSNAVQLDATDPLPFAYGSFDTVLCGEVLEHQPFPEWLIRETARVLVPGGRMVGSVPNAFRLKNRLLFLLGNPFDIDPTHLRFFSALSLHALLADRFADIEIRSIIGRFVKIHPGLFANVLVWRCRRKDDAAWG